MKPKGKGYTAKLRALKPGASVWLPLSVTTATVLAWRLFGAGGYSCAREWQGHRRDGVRVRRLKPEGAQ